MKIRSMLLPALVMALTLGVASGCSSSATEPSAVDPTVLLSVIPSGGTTSVAVGADVVITFNHGMPDAMENYVDLHEGTVTGPEVAGVWSMSSDHMVMTFTPGSAWKPATTYVIHMGGGMMDENGDTVDLEMHGFGMGGQWATQSMMTVGMMGGQTSSHMGAGWAGPSNGVYGMVFTFTTEAASASPAALLSVVPSGGTMNVTIGTTVVITFNHAIPDSMEAYADLHEGTVTGPVVAGSWSLSGDHRVLTFTPALALKPATTYVIHVGGGMMDEDGDHLDLGMYGSGMGGQWATQSMMSGGMMGGQTGGHMGSGWLDAGSGTYGMIFTFTTAG